MTATCCRFLFENTTNIDMLKKEQTYTLAVRIPQNTPPSREYRTITYPLSRTPSQYSSLTDGQLDGHIDPVSYRDEQATRIFAILQAEPGENPWNLGYWSNFKSVMGDNILEWLLPIRHSPCCNHDENESMYRIGPLVTKLKKRYGIATDPVKAENGIEMHNTRGL